MFVVAGVTGRTGGVVAETLLSQGNKKVRVLVRTEDKGARWRERGAEVSVLSLDDARALSRALVGAEGFFTILPEDLGAMDFHGHRTRMADALKSALGATGVPHTVLLSSIAACLPEGNGPARDLHHAERALASTGGRVTTIRASYFQENIASVLPAAKHEGIFPHFFASADTALPMIATRDVGRFAARCLVEPAAKSEIVDLLGPAYCARQLSDRLGALIGKSLHVVDVPASAHVEVLTKAGLPRAFAEAVAELNACFASGRIRPQGDRIVSGTTTIDEVLPGLVTALA